MWGSRVSQKEICRKHKNTTMGPDILTIPSVPESRLKAVVQANAVLHALFSALCLGLREEVAHVFGFPNVVVSVCIGFAMAFHAAFLFRVSIKQPLSTHHVNAAAVFDVFLAIAALFLLFSHVLHYSDPLGAHMLRFLIATHLVFAAALLYLANTSRARDYTPSEIVAV